MGFALTRLGGNYLPGQINDPYQRLSVVGVFLL